MQNRQNEKEKARKSVEDVEGQPQSKKANTHSSSELTPIVTEPTHVGFTRIAASTEVFPPASSSRAKRYAGEIESHHSAEDVFSQSCTPERSQGIDEEVVKHLSSPTKKNRGDNQYQSSENTSLAPPLILHSPEKPVTPPNRVSPTKEFTINPLSKTTDHIVSEKPSMQSSYNNMLATMQVRQEVGYDKAPPDSQTYSPIYFCDELPGAKSDSVRSGWNRPYYYKYIESGALCPAALAKEFGHNIRRAHERMVLYVGNKDKKLYIDRLIYMCVPQITLLYGPEMKKIAGDLRVCEYVKLSKELPIPTLQTIKDYPEAARPADLPVYYLHNDKLYYFDKRKNVVDLLPIAFSNPKDPNVIDLKKSMKFDTVVENQRINLTPSQIWEIIRLAGHDPQHTTPIYEKPPEPISPGFYIFVVTKRRKPACDLQNAYELRIAKLSPSTNGHSSTFDNSVDELIIAGEFYVNKEGKICLVNDKTGSFHDIVETARQTLKLEKEVNIHRHVLNKFIPKECFSEDVIDRNWEKNTLMDIKEKILAPLRNRVFKLLEGSFEEKIPAPYQTLKDIFYRLNDFFEKFMLISFVDGNENPKPTAEEIAKRIKKAMAEQLSVFLRQVYSVNTDLPIDHPKLIENFNVESPYVTQLLDDFTETYLMFTHYRNYHKRFNDLMLAQELLKVGLDETYHPKPRSGEELPEKFSAPFMPIRVKDVTADTHCKIKTFLTAKLEIKLEENHFKIIEEILVSQSIHAADGKLEAKDILRTIIEKTANRPVTLTTEHDQFIEEIKQTIERLAARLKELYSDNYTCYEGLYLLRDRVNEKYTTQVPEDLSPMKAAPVSIPPLTGTARRKIPFVLFQDESKSKEGPGTTPNPEPPRQAKKFN